MINNNGCSFGKVTREKTDQLEKCATEIKSAIEDVRNHYSQRLPVWATILISILIGLIGLMAGIKIS